MFVVMISLGALAVLLLGAVVFAVVVYNGLIRLRNNIDRNWSNIDVLLKQRFDELPRLVEVCKGYIKHERETLEAVTRARDLASRAAGHVEIIRAQNAVTGAVRGLFALAENYPDLKANDLFLRLQARISQLEDSIADRREFYNESVNLYNIAIEQFPDVMVARALSFPRRTLWKIEAGERKAPSASLRSEPI